MISELLPLESESPRCSEFAQSVSLLPPGSGLFLHRVLLVSIPLPWPKPALKHDLLYPASQLVNATTADPDRIRTRLFASEPVSSDPHTTIEVFERLPHGLAHTVLTCETTAEAIAAEVAAVLAAPLGQTPPMSLPPTFLVCTQGSHDVCCGTAGVEFADELQRERPDYVVRRVSHTGGHRFSPTLLAFPSGRMWAFADLDLIDRVAAGTETADDLRLRNRGWWGAAVGPAQVAETAVRIAQLTHGASLSTPLTITTTDANSFVVELDGGTSWQVDVEIGRVVPSISCESPGGVPVKPGREFKWTIAERSLSSDQ